MKAYQFAGYITTFAFITTLITNSILIILTIRHIKNICPTYKWMIVTFAGMGILFSFVETTIRPNIHSFNAAWMYFSPNTSLPKWLLYVGTASISGFFCFLLSYITMQFIYRLWTLTNSPLLQWFHGFRCGIWVFFVITPCMLYIASLIAFMSPDKTSDAYMAPDVLRVYNLNLSDITHFTLLVYDKDKIRWRNMTFMLSSSTVMNMSLGIIVFCALRMRREMKTCLDRLSERNQRLENQFFAALVAQSAFPFFLLVLPTTPILFLPLLNIEVSLQSGFLFTIFSLYPPLDSVAMMMIIKEYRVCMRKCLWKCCKSRQVGNYSLDGNSALQLASAPPSGVNNSIQMSPLHNQISTGFAIP